MPISKGMTLSQRPFITACVFFLFLSLAAVRADDADFLDSFPDSAMARERALSRWFTASPDSVAPLMDESLTDPYGHTFTFSAEKTDRILSVTVSPGGALLPENTLNLAPAAKQSPRGRWIYNRDIDSGEPLSIVVYPVADPEIMVTLRPGAGTKTLVDLSVYGLDVRKGVPLGTPFTALLVAPFSRVVALTGKTMPWNLLAPDTLRYRDVSSAVATIRERLPTLVYLDDGAFDDAGKPVLIETGMPQDAKKVMDAANDGRDISRVRGGVNCSGFVKWIVDGIVWPTAGSGIFIQSLKRSTSAPETGFTERFREDYDLFFALDWVRNLAASVVSLNTLQTVYPENAGINVTVEPFPSATGHKKDVGYRMSELLPLLYWLAINEPGRWYLGALSEERGEVGSKTDPLLRYYHHTVALFPWFDGAGHFRVAIFESAVETDSSTFISREADEWIYLVRLDMPTPSRFDP